MQAGEVSCIPDGADITDLLATACEDLSGLNYYRNLTCGTQIKWDASFLYISKMLVLVFTGLMLYNNAKLTNSINKLLRTEFQDEQEAARFIHRFNQDTLPVALRQDEDSSIKYGIDKPSNPCCSVETCSMLFHMVLNGLLPAIYTRYNENRHEFFTKLPRRFIMRFQAYWTAKTLQTPLCALLLCFSLIISYAVPQYRRILWPMPSSCTEHLVWAHDMSAEYVCHFNSEFTIMLLWVLLQAVGTVLVALMGISWLNASIIMYSKYVYEKERFALGGDDSDPTTSGTSL